MSTTPVKYVGPFDAVEVPAANLLEVKNGETVEVDADLAKSLLDQPDNWRPGKKSTNQTEGA
ncbi:hypothetical protein [Aeromicrobium sp.]|uniref:hypothetical protein n=1 Tax=Aeromicrobium sp. TaxID=1871063 RepID=UPI002FCBFADA